MFYVNGMEVWSPSNPSHPHVFVDQQQTNHALIEDIKYIRSDYLKMCYKLIEIIFILKYGEE